MDTIGDRIRERLESLNMTQRDLAGKIGVTETAVSRYIIGKRIPRRDIAAVIARALYTTVEYLYGFEADDDKDQAFFRVLRIVRKNTKKWTAQQKCEIINSLILGEDE